MTKTQKRIGFLLACIFAVFLWLRIPGLSQPYHQDEYKWALIVAPHSPLAGTIPHPPLSEAIYDLADRVFGNAHLRFMPFFFSIANFFLIFFIARKRYGTRVALIASGLFAVSYYSILASLMVDTDGQILPCYFLIALLGYDRWLSATTTKERRGWLAVFLGGLALGLLTKLSFVLPIATFALDWLYQQRARITKKMIGLVVACGVGGLLLLVGGLLLTRFVFPQFDLATKFAYWMHFVDIASRQWLQILIETFKAALYASPLLIAPLFLMSRETFQRTRLFWIFLGVSAIFYLVLFDFSGGALDRYLQLVVVPFSIIAALVYAPLWDGTWKEWRRELKIPLLVALGIYLLQWLPQAVPPLQPKTDWLGRLVSLRWNFLFPFDGGSGPLGFYVSFALIGISFIVCLGAVMIAHKKTMWRPTMLLTILCVGLMYNVTFAREYLYGSINGNSTIVLHQSLGYISSHPEIQKVITFNDIGAYELMQMGKYQKRLYIDPMFEVTNFKKLNENKGYYFVENIPRINETSAYAKYFSSCDVVYSTESGRISGTVYDCSKAEDIK